MIFVNDLIGWVEVYEDMNYEIWVDYYIGYVWVLVVFL